LPQLRDFKSKIDQTVIRETFTTPTELALKVSHSLSRLQGERSASGEGDVSIKFGDNASFKDVTFVGRDYYADNLKKRGKSHDE
jgi:hypothetical protein